MLSLDRRGVRQLVLVAALAAVASGLGACSRDEKLRCESPERYGSATSVPPLRVPDDLSVPDETEVLRIPDARASGPSGPPEGSPCLESPPDFFGDGDQTG